MPKDYAHIERAATADQALPPSINKATPAFAWTDKLPSQVSVYIVT